MKLLAQKDLDIIKNYVSYKMYSPCEKCSTLEKLSCCGCMKMISYVNTNKESLINYNSLITSNAVFEQRIEMVMNKLMEYEKSLGTYNKTDKALKLEKESLDKILNEIVYDYK